MAVRVGAASNTWMLFVGAAMAFSCYRLPHLAALPWTTTLAVGLTAFAIFNDPFYSSSERHGDRSYAAVITIARELSGTVVCPEDPTIPFFAKGFVGKNLNMELDEAQVRLPPRVRTELANANWVILLSRVIAPKYLQAADLAELGFHPVRVPRLDGSIYSIWQRGP
jgi:hypothetical protein